MLEVAARQEQRLVWQGSKKMIYETLLSPDPESGFGIFFVFFFSVRNQKPKPILFSARRAVMAAAHDQLSLLDSEKIMNSKPYF